MHGHLFFYFSTNWNTCYIYAKLQVQATHSFSTKTVNVSDITELIPKNFPHTTTLKKTHKEVISTQ